MYEVEGMKGKSGRLLCEQGKEGPNWEGAGRRKKGKGDKESRCDDDSLFRQNECRVYWTWENY